MATYERSTHVDAPLETVWDFYSRVSGLARVTPGWLDLRVESVRSHDGEVVADPTPGSGADDLRAGSVITMSVVPAGVGPRQRWSSRILERERTEGSAYFRDQMVEGPFPEWVHTHLFYRDGEGTLVRDVVRYELPGGGLGRRLGPVARVGFEPMFAYRHRRTKQLLEDHDTRTDGQTGGGNDVSYADV